MSKKRFTFSVLTFNHEHYIIEHLESIKFLIETFGAAYNFSLIIADDGSRDQTVALANKWLLEHGGLFLDTRVLGDGTNNGTCFNYTRLWPLIESDLFKITAGDDVYACTNIFNEVEKYKSNDFFSGLPLLLIDGKLLDSRATHFHILASDIIYKEKKLIDRIRGVSSINTPSLFCAKHFLKDAALFDYINNYKVTEDFPMMVKVATSYEDTNFIQSKEIYIYYRRTSGSTYLIRGSDFDLDKLKAFGYLLEQEKSLLGKIILKNRIYCYKIDNTLFKKLFNIGYYAYLFRVFVNLLPILKSHSQSRPDTSKHQSHYDLIVKRANFFYETLNTRTPIQLNDKGNT